MLGAKAQTAFPVLFKQLTNCPCTKYSLIYRCNPHRRSYQRDERQQTSKDTDSQYHTFKISFYEPQIITSFTGNIRNVKKNREALLKAINEYYVEGNAEKAEFNVSYENSVRYKSQRKPHPWGNR